MSDIAKILVDFLDTLDMQNAILEKLDYIEQECKEYGIEVGNRPLGEIMEDLKKAKESEK